MEENLKADVIMHIDNVKLYEIIENSKRLITIGGLRVLNIRKQNIYLLLVEDFSYSLSKELSVMRSTHNQYVFPTLNGFLGVVIPESTDFQLLEAFESLLFDTTDFILSGMRHDENQLLRSQTFDLEAAEKVNTYTKSRKISLLIESGGASLKRSIVRAATFTSSGIRRGSEYLMSKIEKKESPVEVEPSHSKALSGIKAVSSVALMLSKALVAGAVATTKEIGNYVNARFDKSDTSKKLERSSAYQSAKVIGKAGLSAAATIYDGLEEALVIMGKSTASATVDVVDHRYGGKARKVTEEAMNILGDVGLMGRELNKIGVRTAVQAAKEMKGSK